MYFTFVTDLALKPTILNSAIGDEMPDCPDSDDRKAISEDDMQDSTVEPPARVFQPINEGCEFSHDPCRLGSPMRKVISHVFGRNKSATATIPSDLIPKICKQFGSNGVAGSSGEDGGSAAGNNFGTDPSQAASDVANALNNMGGLGTVGTLDGSSPAITTSGNSASDAFAGLDSSAAAPADNSQSAAPADSSTADSAPADSPSADPSSADSSPADSPPADSSSIQSPPEVAR